MFQHAGSTRHSCTICPKAQSYLIIWTVVTKLNLCCGCWARPGCLETHDLSDGGGGVVQRVGQQYHGPGAGGPGWGDRATGRAGRGRGRRIASSVCTFITGDILTRLTLMFNGTPFHSHVAVPDSGGRTHPAAGAAATGTTESRLRPFVGRGNDCRTKPSPRPAAPSSACLPAHCRGTRRGFSGFHMDCG